MATPFNLGEAARGITMAFTDGGLAEGTNAGTIKTVAAVTYAIDGVFYSKAITDNIAVTASPAQADLTTCLYTVSVDSAGAVTVTKGTEVLTADYATSGAEWPMPPQGNCAIGGIKVVTSGATFTAGTTDLGAAGITDTYYDFATVPAARG